MREHVTFRSGGKEYHAEAWFDEDRLYDCTECYTFDDDLESVDVDWEDYREEIEYELGLPRRRDVYNEHGFLCEEDVVRYLF